MSDDIRQNPGVIRHTSPQSIRLAKTLMRSAKFGALAVIDPDTAEPFVSRVAVATCMDGAPLILVSSLSMHTQAMRTMPSCSLLLGEPGKGDPLAYPRITLQCEAQFLDRQNETGKLARARYLRHNPKSKLYADFGDFSFCRLDVKRASLNGGFGQAYKLTSDDILANAQLCAQIDPNEASILDHMNKDHADAVAAIAKANCDIKTKQRWVLTGVDAEGVSLASSDKRARAWFNHKAASIDDMRQCLVDLAKSARNSNI